MKFRMGFVTNSSSSSYVCEVCREVESGYDLSLEEAGMYICECGHMFCQAHAVEVATDKDEAKILASYFKRKLAETNYTGPIDIEEARQYVAKYDSGAHNNSFFEKVDEYYEIIISDYENMPLEICPICNMKEINNDMLADYLCVKFGVKMQDVEAEMKERFDNIDDYRKYINGKDDSKRVDFISVVRQLMTESGEEE
jgi:hypothetical protein